MADYYQHLPTARCGILRASLACRRNRAVPRSVFTCCLLSSAAQPPCGFQEGDAMLRFAVPAVASGEAAE